MPSVGSVSSSKRLRTLALVLFGLLLVVFFSASGIARIYTDWLWFDHLDLASVWRTVLTTQVVLVVVCSVIFFVILWGNLTLADRLAPDVRAASPEEDLIDRYHQLVGPHGGKIRLAVALMFALVAGVDTSTQWQTWLMFRNGGEFGWTDPLFNKDAGFYVFELPFWTFVIDGFFAAMVLALLLSLVAHYLNGGIRAAVVGSERVTASVKLHLSGLLAVLAILRALAYWHDRYELVNSRRGVFDGALATDVAVQLPALNLLTLISVFGAVLFIVNIWRRGWGLPLVAVGLWAVSHIVIGGIYPALYQNLRVEPAQSSREAEFIGRNITATRYAYSLGEDDLTTIDYDYKPRLTSDEVEQSSEILDDVALIDAELATEPFTRSQGERAYYEFSSPLDVDRYEIDGDLEPVVLSLRSLNLSAADQGWENQHLAYTHGLGVALAPSDRVASGGQPDFLIEGVGPNLTVDPGFESPIDRPQIYFSEGFEGYSIIDTDRTEIDYAGDSAAGDGQGFRYDGEGAIDLGGVLRRSAFAMRFQNYRVLISGLVNDDSAVIYDRSVEERVGNLAPFLQFDSDPYPAIIEGKILWIVDGYTTTDRFPYSQHAESRSLAGTGADLAGGYNYVRNSVKATVDAYDGTVTMYVVDDTDPLIEAWSKSFPELFTDASEIPPALAEHFRYPADIFKVQTDMWASYQVSDPVQHLQGDRAWSVASQPAAEANEVDPAAGSIPMNPQYRVTQLPGQSDSEFIVQRAFVPRSGNSATARPELTAVLVARSDPEHYGELIEYRLPSGQVPALDLVNADIQKEDGIAELITLLGQNGSSVLFGEMQLVMMADTIVYIRPLYIEAEANTAVPELNRVVAVNDERIAMAQTVEAAVAAVTVDVDPDAAPASAADDDDPGGAGSSSSADGGSDNASGNDAGSSDGSGNSADGGGDSGSGDGDVDRPTVDTDGLSVAELLSLADELLARAEAAEADGNSVEAADLRAQARLVIERMGEQLGVEIDTPTPAAETGEA